MGVVLFDGCVRLFPKQVDMKTSSDVAMIKRLSWILMFSAFLMAVNNVWAAPVCGNLNNAYGPFDYASPEGRKKLGIVDSNHFTAEVESLIRGKSGYLWSDLDYTLRAFPNHHRALHAFARYERRERAKSRQNNKPYRPPVSASGFPATAECYFDRAIRWRPNDPAVRLIYGIHLHLTGKLQQALEQYKLSEKIQPNVADLQYNLGLLYFDLKQYALAKQHARKAYQLGYPLPGLRKKLASVGQWP